MKYQFNEGDGVICENPSEANKLLVLALNNGYRAWSFTDTCNCFSAQTGIFCLCQESDIKRQISPSDFTALIQGKLPQYWCFDIREKDSDKALAYFNGKYKIIMSGMFYTYYGFDGTKNAMALDELEQFKNSPFLLPVQYILDAADEEKRIEEEKRILDNNVKLFDAARPKYMDELIKRFSHVFTESENSFKPKPMTKEQLKKHGELILAWANGEKIQFQSGLNSWHDVIGDPIWSLSREYRIKPKSEYVPFDFTDASILRNKWIRVKNGGAEWMITGIGKTHVALSFNSFSYADALEQLEFLDCSPCGKLIP